MWRHTNIQRISLLIYAVNAIVFAIWTNDFLSSLITNSLKLTWLSENFLIRPILYVIFAIITVYYIKEYKMNIVYSIILSIIHLLALPYLIYKSYYHEWRYKIN